MEPNVVVSICAFTFTLFGTAFYSGRELGKTSEKVQNVKVVTEQQEKEIEALKQSVELLAKTTHQIQISVAVLTDNIAKMASQLDMVVRKVNNG